MSVFANKIFQHRQRAGRELCLVGMKFVTRKLSFDGVKIRAKNFVNAISDGTVCELARSVYHTILYTNYNIKQLDQPYCIVSYFFLFKVNQIIVVYIIRPVCILVSVTGRSQYRQGMSSQWRWCRVYLAHIFQQCYHRLLENHSRRCCSFSNRHPPGPLLLNACMPMGSSRQHP
jgi:hypothetical protein